MFLFCILPSAKWWISSSAISAHCLVFSFPGLSPLTLINHRSTSENHHSFSKLNFRAHKRLDWPPHYSSSIHPFLLQKHSSTNRRLLFRRRRLQQAAQAFPVGGTLEQRHSWARHLHFLSLLTTHWKTYRLEPFLFYTLLDSFIQQQVQFKFQDNHRWV